MKETETIEIRIVPIKRTSETFIPEQLIRSDYYLVKGIKEYCEQNNLEPIYIDECLAVFPDKYLLAAYPEEI